MMRGFKAVDRLSREECQKLLRTERDPEVKADIKKRLDMLDMELQKKEDNAYFSCNSINDYQNYIRKYPNGAHISDAESKISELRLKTDNEQFAGCKTIDDYQHYISAFDSPLHEEEAIQKIDDLFWEKNRKSKTGCERYLAKYQSGRHVSEANDKIKSVVRHRIVWIVILIIGAILFYIGYHPSGEVLFDEAVNNVQFDSSNNPSFVVTSFSSPKILTFPLVLVTQSSSSKTISFPKEGGSREVSFSSNSSNDNVEINTSSSWISAKKSSNGKITISVPQNEGDKRKGRVEVKVYSTLFGVRTSSNTGVIYVEQSSGYASYLTVSSSELSFNQNGGTRSITVNTDGYWSIDETTASWGHVSINGDTITLKIDSNNDGDRTDYFTLKSGDKTCRINIAQSGILATYLQIEKDKVIASIDGTEKGKCYPVTYYTDGKTVKSYTDSDWITVWVAESSSRVEIKVASNSGLRRSGNVYIEASGIKKTITVTQQGKTFSLSVSPHEVSFPASGGSRTISVSASDSWEISVDTESWGHLTRSGDILTIRVDSNDASNSRTDYFKIKCGDKDVIVSISQDGKTQTTSSGNNIQVMAEISWMIGYVNYTGLMVIYTNNRGIFKLRTPNVIVQDVVFSNPGTGYTYFRCSNPRYTNNQPASGYAADNFVVYPNGRMVTSDASGISSMMITYSIISSSYWQSKLDTYGL